MACTTCDHSIEDHAEGACVNRTTRFDADLNDTVTTTCPCTTYVEVGTVPVDADVLAGAEVEPGTGIEAPETATRMAGSQLYSRVGTDVQYLAEESPDGQITVTAVGSDVRETVTAEVWAAEFTPA